MAIFYYATCHNLGPSLTIIIDDGNQYIYIFLKAKNLHNATCQILMDGWKLVISTWHYGYNCNGVA